MEFNLKVDLHVHTIYSYDSLLSLRTLVKACKRRCINCIAVTDHNTIEGALKMRAYPIKVIIGEEITTKDGEIIGLFLNEEIPRNLSVQETIDKIKEQDGIVYIPHPFDRMRKSRLRISDDNIWRQANIIEVFNSRCIFQEDNRKALNFAEVTGSLRGYGSDAHTNIEVGNTYVKMVDFYSRKEFLKNLKDGIPYCKRSPILVHAYTKVIKLLK